MVQWLGLVVFNSGDADVIPGSKTKIPHAKGQLLSPHTLDPVLRSKRSLNTAMERSPHPTTRESPLALGKIQCSQKI